MSRLLKVLGILLVIVILIVGGAVAWLALRSPAQRPPSTERFEPAPERLARGRYLVNHVADCLGCHSGHIENAWAFPVKPGTEGSGGFTFDEKLGLPGRVSAQNITSDRETGIGAWTDGEILRAMREGVDREGKALFPMMPYEHFRHMDDEDAKSIVVYLRTIAPIRNVVPDRKLNFPVNLFVKFAPKPLEEPVKAPQRGDSVAYGKYLATIGGCIECHTPKDEKGQPLPGRQFAGGWEMHGPWGRVVTANLTPHPQTYIGRSTREEFIGRFKSFAGFDPLTAPPPAKGRNTVMPWLAFAGMEEQDLGAIYDFLKTLEPIEHVVVSFPDAAPVSEAQGPS